MILIRLGKLTYGLLRVSEGTVEVKVSAGPPYNWAEERLMLPASTTLLDGIQEMIEWGKLFEELR